MNSKGIYPRIGMQCLFTCRGYASEGYMRRVTSVDREGGEVWFNKGLNTYGCRIAFFMAGNYEIVWTPPTKEERKMLRSAAKTFPEMGEVFESLAMDGL